MPKPERIAELKTLRSDVWNITLGFSRAEWNVARETWARVSQALPGGAPVGQLRAYFADGGRPEGSTRLAILEYQRILLAWLDGYIEALSE